MKRFLISLLFTIVVTIGTAQIQSSNIDVGSQEVAADTAIKDTDELVIEKLKELFEISKEIAEKQELVDRWEKQGHALFNENPAIREQMSGFIQELKRGDKKNSARLREGFFDDKDHRISFIKCWMMRYDFDRLLVDELIARYKRLLLELLEFFETLET